jgi:tetratricopeptide (TPR) repeat protein
MPIQNDLESLTDAQGKARTPDAAISAKASRWQQIAGTLLSESWLMRMSLALIFALYVRAVGFAPVYDDNIIGWSGGWSDVPKFFTSDIFGSSGTAHSVYYRPLSMTWGLLVGYCTGGAPGWLHLVAILMHLTVVILAYVLGRHLLRDERLALLSALLFGLHPSKVESVAWIGSSMVDGFGGILFFATLIAFLKWCESGKRCWMVASVALFAAAMFTKETMVAIPILIATYLLLTPDAGTRKQLSDGDGPTAGPPAADAGLLARTARTLRTLLPYGVVWVVYMAIRHQVIKPPAAGAQYIHPTFTHNNLWTAPYSIWWYLQHLVMPWGLSVEYAPKVIDYPTLVGFVFPAAGIVLLLVTAVWLCWRQGSRVAAFLMLWFAVNLAPPVIVAPMVLQHDRYLYLPAYAFCALIAWGILRLGKFSGKARLIVALCVVALWSGLTWHEMSYWDCDMTLWSRVLEISPSHVRAQIQVASLYNQAGDPSKALNILSDGLRYRPNSPNLWLSRADILAENQELNQAQEAYLKVMQVTEPALGQAVELGAPALDRAEAAYRLALMDIKAKNFVEAEHYSRIALGLQYDGVGYHSVLSASLRGEGRLDEAVRENALEMQLRMAQQHRQH